MITNLSKNIVRMGLIMMMSQLACAENQDKNQPQAEDHVRRQQCNSTMVSMKHSSQLPVLHKIQEFTFLEPYSCQKENSRYTTSALFLSSYSKEMNGPDLLYNGACGSKKYFDASTAGDDFTLIADLGEVSLEEATAHKAFNWRKTVGYDNSFQQKAEVLAGHTYAVLIAKSDIRALYYIQVSEINGMSVKTRYAVKSYSLQETVASSIGFAWEQGNE